MKWVQENGGYIAADDGFLVTIAYKREKCTIRGYHAGGIHFNVKEGTRTEIRPGFWVTETAYKKDCPWWDILLVPLTRKNQKALDRVAREIEPFLDEIIRLAKQESVEAAMLFIVNKYRKEMLNAGQIQGY
jgi:hypothetical protein